MRLKVHIRHTGYFNGTRKKDVGKDVTMCGKKVGDAVLEDRLVDVNSTQPDLCKMCSWVAHVYGERSARRPGGWA